MGTSRGCQLAVLLMTVLLVTGFISVMSSCGHPLRPARDSADISVEHPGLTVTYAQMAVVWRIAWWDGERVRLQTLPAQPAVEPIDTALPLDRHGAEVVVVQATAHVVGGGTLAPLGAWGAPPQSHLTLTPTFGRAAEAVLHVARRGLNPALVNLSRLQETVAEECGDQPETLDQERLIEGLGTGEMTRYAIRRRARPECEVALAAPHTDVWISHDPTEETLEGVWAESNCYWVVPVAEGEVRHLWQWGTAEPGDRWAAAPSRYSAPPQDSAAPQNPAPQVAPAASPGPARRLTVGRGRDGHAFWFITEM